MLQLVKNISVLRLRNKNLRLNLMERNDFLSNGTHPHVPAELFESIV